MAGTAGESDSGLHTLPEAGVEEAEKADIDASTGALAIDGDGGGDRAAKAPGRLGRGVKVLAEVADADDAAADAATAVGEPDCRDGDEGRRGDEEKG